MSISIFPNYFHETHRFYQNVLPHFHPPNDISCPLPIAFRYAVNFDTERLREDFSVVRAGIASAAFLQHNTGYEGW
jgi:hypothetical protein